MVGIFWETRSFPLISFRLSRAFGEPGARWGRIEQVLGAILMVLGAGERIWGVCLEWIWEVRSVSYEIVRW